MCRLCSIRHGRQRCPTCEVKTAWGGAQIVFLTLTTIIQMKALPISYMKAQVEACSMGIYTHWDLYGNNKAPHPHTCALLVLDKTLMMKRALAPKYVLLICT
jgi:hypothetical protein